MKPGFIGVWKTVETVRKNHVIVTPLPRTPIVSETFREDAGYGSHPSRARFLSGALTSRFTNRTADVAATAARTGYGHTGDPEPGEPHCRGEGDQAWGMGLYLFGCGQHWPEHHHLPRAAGRADVEV
jgi:hypothetical protein